jgi:hypothetical protein
VMKNPRDLRDILALLAAVVALTAVGRVHREPHVAQHEVRVTKYLTGTSHIAGSSGGRRYRAMRMSFIRLWHW